MVFCTNTSRIQLIFHSLSYTHMYSFAILAYPTSYILKRKKNYLIEATEWSCTLFNGLATLISAITGAVNRLAKGSSQWEVLSRGSNHSSGQVSS